LGPILWGILRFFLWFSFIIEIAHLLNYNAKFVHWLVTSVKLLFFFSFFSTLTCFLEQNIWWKRLFMIWFRGCLNFVETTLLVEWSFVIVLSLLIYGNRYDLFFYLILQLFNSASLPLLGPYLTSMIFAHLTYWSLNKKLVICN
jgi:hypothetical protein